MRRSIKVSAWTAGVIVLLLVALLGLVLIAGNTDSGRGMIERLTFRLTAGYVKLAGLRGSFPTQLTLVKLQLIDREGVWLTADDIALSWSPWKLLDHQIQVDTLHVARLHMERAPVSNGQSGKASVPYIDVRQFAAEIVELGAPLTGRPVSLSLKGNVRLRSLEDANADVEARRTDGDGQYTLHVAFDPHRTDASLVLNEPADGPLENILALPGLGALSATATLHGPHDAARLDLVLDAGDVHAAVQGGIDLAHQTADLDYRLSAPALAPRPEVAWTALSLKGTWHGSVSTPAVDGRLEVEGLRIADDTKISKLTAHVTGAAGTLTAHATVDGLEIPGPQRRLFAKSPVTLDASMQLDQPTRPLDLRATHSLASVNGHMDTRAGKSGEYPAAADIKILDLVPFAALLGQDVRGNAAINARLNLAPTGDTLETESSIALTGGTAQWIRYAGPRVAMRLNGSLSDRELKIDSLKVAGRGVTFAANGSAARMTSTGTTAAKPGAGPAFIRDLQARWQLDVADLSMFSAAVAGSLKGTGKLSGTPQSMIADADLVSKLSVRGSPSGVVEAKIQARGLPSAPGGTIQASGSLDGAPLNLDASVERAARDTFRMLVRRAEWKSARVDGSLSADAAFTQSHGQLHIRMTELGDLDRLLGVNLAGSIEGDVGFVPAAAQGHTQGRLQMDAKNLVVDGFAGNAHLDALGTFDAVALRLSADLPDLYGSPASLTSAAVLNIGAQELRLENASVKYRGETIQLQDATVVSFAKGVAVDNLRVGDREAVFTLKGQLSPTLNVRASLRQVNPALINAFVPGLVQSGTIEARARLTGLPSNPTGNLRFDANSIRFADAAATGLPPLEVHARAQLADNTASIDAKLTAGAGSQMTAAGTVPLNANGALDLKVGGTLDLGMVNPILEARGMHATGQLTIDSTVTGSAADPQVGGGITLARGSVRDYVRGVNLSDISAEIAGHQGDLSIKSFRAKAGSGTVGITGTFGLLKPLWPLDLKITAKDAQPIASSIITATLDADVQVSGTVREKLDVAGTIDVKHATIGIPNSLPPDVVVLDVRRRGKTAADEVRKELVIGVNLAINAPQEVLVQGRGLDAELGGRLRLNGMSDQLSASGTLDLLRGNFSLAGNKLTFSEGRVSFGGAGLRKKIDPTLDFTAQKSVGDTTATLRITGLADAPRFEFSSTPSLPQDDILALLLFGVPNAAQLSALQVAQIGAAVASLSGVGGDTLNPLVKIQKSLGLDRLSVGSNTNTATGTEASGAAIEAGRYVSKRVYVEGRQSTTGTSQVQVDVDLTKNLKLRTRLGNGTANTQGTTPENDPGSSIGLSYQIDY